VELVSVRLLFAFTVYFHGGKGKLRRILVYLQSSLFVQHVIRALAYCDVSEYNVLLFGPEIPGSCSCLTVKVFGNDDNKSKPDSG
jgi:hypothetical protein